MAESGAANWQGELDRPSAGFFKAFADRVQDPGGPEAAARMAVLRLTPAVDWAAHLPHMPHGLLGLQAVFRLRPLLRPASFLRVLATQIHAFAHDARSPEGRGLAALGLGSGHWGNLEMALGQHRPAIAWGEAAALAEPAGADFGRLEAAVEADMANVGHKPVLARRLADLHRDLGGAADLGRILLAMAAWHGASEPRDTFWHDRAAHRLGEARPVPWGEPAQGAEAHRAQVREICDTGLVEVLDRFSARVKVADRGGDLLAVLALAAAEKQLDARRDLEGKTSWNFVYLAALAQRAGEPGGAAPTRWVQAAALVNLFPSGEEEDRPRGMPPRTPPGDSEADLVDAILDGEPLPAMALAQDLAGRGGPEPVLRALAEAASGNDPAFNHSHQLLAVAALADLLPFLPAPAQAAALVAVAKSLANAQGSSDLGRLADAALRRAGVGA